MVAPCTMVPLPCSGTSTSWSSWPGAGPLPSSHRFACTAFVPAAFFCSFWLNMRRRRASQSAQRNAAFSHALNSSPPRSAERTTQEPGAPHRGSSDDFLEHLGPKAAGRLTKIEQSTAQHRPLIGGCSAQPSIAQVFAKQRLLQSRPKLSPGPLKRYGPLPTVADLAIGPALPKPSPLAVVRYPAPQTTALALAARPPIKRPARALHFNVEGCNHHHPHLCPAAFLDVGRQPRLQGEDSQSCPQHSPGRYRQHRQRWWHPSPAKSGFLRCANHWHCACKSVAPYMASADL